MVQVVEVPGAYSTAQAGRTGDRKKKRPRPGEADAKKPGKQQPARKPIWKSVNELGAEQFTGRQKRAHEERKITSAGGRAPKRQSYPLKMLLGMRAKQRKREAREEEEERQSGVVTGKRRRSSAGSAARERKLKGDKEADVFGPAPTVGGGKFRDGVFRVKTATKTER
jgi:hypothetical protein